jgi:TRAP-type C4-dicarboxylate transport system permease small subunit
MIAFALIAFIRIITPYIKNYKGKKHAKNTNHFTQQI